MGGGGEGESGVVVKYFMMVVVVPAVVTTVVAVMVVVIVMTVAVALIGRLSVARDRPHDLQGNSPQKPPRWSRARGSPPPSTAPPDTSGRMAYGSQ